MRYYSTRNKKSFTSFENAVIKGLAPDGALYMPERIPQLSKQFFNNIASLSDSEIAFNVASALFSDDIPQAELQQIVEQTVSFPCEVNQVEKDIYALELFHGPTLAFKDFGARFMSRVLRHIVSNKKDSRAVNVLVATSGDTGSAVANGFLDVEGVNVYVLYPKNKVSKAQEAQFATLGNNIMAIEVNGTFDDCQRIVKEAFANKELNQRHFLTSANSINVARLLPQTFYYFIAFARLVQHNIENNIVISVPSGNFGNITAGVIAMMMGMPVKKFIAANNANDVFYQYLITAKYEPRKSIETLANAMDVGNPSNFERLLELLNNHKGIKKIISSVSVSDNEIIETIRTCYNNTGYMLDPHGACAYYAIKKLKNTNSKGLFLETAHPAKFKETVEKAINKTIPQHPVLQEFMKRKKISYPIQPVLDEIIEILDNKN